MRRRHRPIKGKSVDDSPSPDNRGVGSVESCIRRVRSSWQYPSVPTGSGVARKRVHRLQDDGIWLGPDPHCVPGSHHLTAQGE